MVTAGDRGGVERSVFAHERIDPSGNSLRWLEERGVRVERGWPMWEFPQRFLTEDELVERARGFTALMGSSGHRITRRVIESLPDLRYIAKYGIGVDAIDMEAAREREILVTNTPIPDDYEAVCEHTVAVILALLKRLTFYGQDHLFHGGWRTGRAFPSWVKGKTIGLIGLGRIARGVAERLGAFQPRFVAYDPYVTTAPTGITLLELPELLATSDVVSLHAVATADNHNLLGRDEIAMLKPDAVVVNTARGSLLDLDALSDAVATGHVAGAALDVYPVEPPDPDHPIFRQRGVIATPHVSGWTRETCEAMGQAGAESLWDMFRGVEPRYLVREPSV